MLLYIYVICNSYITLEEYLKNQIDNSYTKYYRGEKATTVRIQIDDRRFNARLRLVRAFAKQS